MAAHQDITDRAFHGVDLSSYTVTARGVDGPKGALICMVYAPADSVCYMQTGDVTDATTNIATDGGPIPTQQWIGLPCGPDDAGSDADVRRPSVYFQGDANIHVRFVGRGIA